jgi:hypothetical protein
VRTREPQPTRMHCHNMQIDTKNHKTFLARSKSDTVRGENLYVGGVVTVFARQLKIVGLGDPYTKRQLEAKSER